MIPKRWKQVRPFVLATMVGLTVVVLAACTGQSGISGLSDLQVVIENVPAGASAKVLVTGPESFSRIITESSQFTNLVAGSYNVLAYNISGTSRGYSPADASQVVSVGPSGTAVVTVEYEPIETVLAQNTVFLPPGALVSFEETIDSTRLEFDSTAPELLDVEIGSIVYLGVTSLVPYGFLGEVTSISSGAVTIVINAVPAPLTSLILEGAISYSQDLRVQDVEGVSVLAMGFDPMVGTGTVDPQLDFGRTICGRANGAVLDTALTATGEVCFTVSAHFDATFYAFKMPDTKFTITVEEHAELDVTYTGLGASIEQKYPLATYNFGVIMVPVGLGIAIPVTPTLTLFIGVDGSVTAEVTTKATQTLSYTAGLVLEGGVWSRISTHNSDFQYVPPTLTANARLKAYAGAELFLRIAGLAGPTFSASGYFELDADVTRTPLWRLYGGLDGEIGIEVSLLKWGVERSETIFEVRRLLAQGGEPTPARHRLSVSRSGPGTVTSSPSGISCGATCTAQFDEGTTIRLSATPSSGAEFVSWSGACVGTGPCTIQMNSTRSVSAQFEYSSTMPDPDPDPDPDLDPDPDPDPDPNPNQPPVVTNFGGSPDEIEEGERVTFSWTASDPDGDPLSCSISFGDGSQQQISNCAGSRSTTYRYDEAGVYNVTLIANDGRGGMASVHERIYVDEPAPSNSPPRIDSFTASASNWAAPATVTFRWQVSDPNAGDLLSCAIATGDGSPNQAFVNCRTTTSYTHTYTTPGEYLAVFVVSDPYGESDSANRWVDVDQPAVSVPTISSVSPSSPQAIWTGQTVDIYGSNFVYGAGVRLLEVSSGIPYEMDDKATFINSGHIRLNNVTFGTPAGAWRVTVRNYPNTSSEVTSAPFTFYTR